MVLALFGRERNMKINIPHKESSQFSIIFELVVLSVGSRKGNNATNGIAHVALSREVIVPRWRIRICFKARYLHKFHVAKSRNFTPSKSAM